MGKSARASDTNRHQGLLVGRAGTHQRVRTSRAVTSSKDPSHEQDPRYSIVSIDYVNGHVDGKFAYWG